MKIITWNCNGAFRKKYNILEKENADIYIIQECENPNRISNISKAFELFTKDHLWIGENKNKGLGVFIKNGISIEKIELDCYWNGQKLKWFLPFKVNGMQNIIGVWSHHGDSDEYRYIGQFWCFLQKNIEKLHETIIIGDFNSNAIWDYKRNECTHTNCVKKLKEIGIESIYHSIKNMDHGKESIYTFYLQKKEDKKYHIDYIFSPLALLSKTKSFEIHNFSKWKELSDHVPLVWEY